MGSVPMFFSIRATEGEEDTPLMIEILFSLVRCLLMGDPFSTFSIRVPSIPKELLHFPSEKSPNQAATVAGSLCLSQTSSGYPRTLRTFLLPCSRLV